MFKQAKMLKRKFLRITLLSLISLVSVSAHGTVYTTTQDGDWSSSSTWSGGNVPSYTDWSSNNSVMINNNVTISGSVTLQGKANITISNTGSLDVTGNLTLSNSYTFTANGSLTVGGDFVLDGPVFNGNPTMNIGGSLTIDSYKGSIFEPSTIQATIGGDFNSTGDVNIGTGTLDIGNNFNVTGGSILNIDANMTVGNNIDISSGPATVFNGTVNVTNDLIKSGGSSMSFYDNVNIHGSTSLTGSGTSKEFYVGPSSYFYTTNFSTNGGFDAWVDGVLDVSSGTLDLGVTSGGGVLEGTGIVGWNTFTSTWSYMKCSNGTEYDGQASSSTPYPPANPINLSTCAADVLSVEFANVQGTAVEDYILIEWETVTEKNNKRFEIQRAVDRSNFKTIGTIAGAGNSNSPIQYQFKDYDFTGQSAYYRIKQIDDEAEHFHFSDVIYVEKNQKPLHAYPNPVAEGGTVTINETSNVISYSIVSTTGSVMMDEAVNTPSGNIVIKLDDACNKGLYFLNVYTTNGLKIEKLLVQ